MLLVLPLLLASVFAKIILTNPSMHVDLQLGQTYQYAIPMSFNKFQNCRLMQVKRETLFYQTPICQIRYAQRQASAALVSRVDLNTTDKTILRDLIIYQFSQLKAFNIFVHAAKFQNLIAAVYRSKLVNLYQLEGGSIRLRESIELNHIPAVQNARFVVCEQSLLLFVGDTYKIGINGSYEAIKGYKHKQVEIFDIWCWGNQIYIGAGKLGLIKYVYNDSLKQLKYMNSTMLSIGDHFSNTSIGVYQFKIDKYSKYIYFLDIQEGVGSINLEDIKFGQPASLTPRILMSGCSNLIVTAFHIYVTCPQLIQINKLTGNPEQVSRSSFDAVEAELIDQRIYMYGHQQFAVYDIFGNVLQEHKLGFNCQKSFIIDQFIVSFTNSFVSSSLIVSPSQTLYCHTSSEERIGVYRGSFVSEGLCSEYMQNPQPNNQYCKVLNPFTLNVKSSQKPTYQLQIAVGVAWAVLVVVFALVYLISKFIAHSTYKQLIEQESREALQNLPQVKYSKQMSEQAVAAV